MEETSRRCLGNVNIPVYFGLAQLVSSILKFYVEAGIGLIPVDIILNVKRQMKASHIK